MIRCKRPIPVQAPFGDITIDVRESQWVDDLPCDRTGAAARVGHSPCVSGQEARVISEKECSCRACSRCVFPFGLGWQPIRVAGWHTSSRLLARRKRAAVIHGLLPRDPIHRPAGVADKLAGVAEHRRHIFPLSNLVSAHPKTFCDACQMLLLISLTPWLVRGTAHCKS